MYVTSDKSRSIFWSFWGEKGGIKRTGCFIFLLFLFSRVQPKQKHARGAWARGGYNYIQWGNPRFFPNSLKSEP